MMPRHLFRRLALTRRGSISLLFAILLVPMILAVGIAVDYSIYIRARTQLNLAADAAAVDATRVASKTYSNGQNTSAAATQAGQTAGTQWFNAQLGSLQNVSVPTSNLAVNVTYTVSPGGFTSTVGYSGTVKTVFGRMFNIPTLPIAGSASSVITNTYVEILMMVDNSGSMMLGSTTSDISALEHATMCSTQAATANQPMSAYSWNYTGNYGYGSGKVPPPATTNGACDPAFTGDASLCFYAPTVADHVTAFYIPPLTPAGSCTNGGGGPGTYGATTTPQAPCGFACHDSATNNDYYGLARSLGITLRLDVVLSAAANVIKTLQADQQLPGQFSVGVYQFNSALARVYPATGVTEAGTDLATALSLTQAITPPVEPNAGNTDFPDSVTTLASGLNPAGNGASPTTPQKAIFIVTDGLNDTAVSGSRIIAPITSSTNEQVCKKFKNLGFNVFVLYTPYLPIPNPFYLQNVSTYTEPTSSSALTASLQACASTPSNLYVASDPTDINNALQAMLKSALTSADRISQ